MKWRLLAVLAVVCLLCGMFAAGGTGASADTVRYGITLDEDGNFRLNGKRLYAYGVNAAAGDIWHDPFDTVYEKCLDTLAKYDIPITRSLITFGTITDYELYLSDPDEFWKTSERMLDMALEAEIGVIVHVISSMTFTSMLGEKASAIGDVNSKSMAFMRNWTRDMVTRFKNHPAVWGWEIGNEMNLEQDLVRNEAYEYIFGPQVGEPDAFDNVSAAEYQVCKREIAKVIREVDPYRIISSGDAMQREAANSLRQASEKMNEKHEWKVDWSRDTLKDWLNMSLYCTPDPVDTISTHYGMTYDDYSFMLRDATLTNEQLLSYYVRLAKENKKGFYFGEFGNMGVYGMTLDPALVEDAFPKCLATLQKTGVQLATLWQRNGANYTVTDEGPLAYMIAEIGKVNESFRKRGLQDTEAYWKAAKSALASTTTASTTGTTEKTTGTATSCSAASTTATHQTTATPPPAVETYMLSQSTKLHILPESNTIEIEKLVTLDVFVRSIALRDGYRIVVENALGKELTQDSAQVEQACRVTVFAPDGTRLRQFAVAVTEKPSAPSQATTVGVASPDDAGGFLWIWWVVAVVLLAGVGTASVLWTVRRKV